MSIAIFGKLPARRDFLALDLPQSVLLPWENWLQREIAASRQALDRGWNAAFLSAPIWRFWCGARVLGRGVAGVMMPSVDGVGRYFPLTLLALAEPGRQFLAPDVDPAEAFFGALEAASLSALDAPDDHEGLLARLAVLTPPAPDPEEPASPAFVSADADAASWRAWHARRALEGASLWWTIGGENFAPRRLGVEGLPGGALFAAMLTGRFEADS